MTFIKNKISRTMAVATVAAVTFSGAALAEKATGNASVQVQNNFTVTEDVALSFGTVVAIAEGDAANTGDVAEMVVNSDGVTADSFTQGTLASLVAISPGNRAEFSVSGAAPNTVLTITNPSAFTLTDPSSGDTKIFNVDTFTNSVITSGTAFTYDTDATGVLVFGLGATLGTDNVLAGSAGAVAYDNVTFTGTYTMTVNY